MRPPIENSSIMITGTSSGIGWEMALQLAQQAKILVLVARRKERLLELETKLKKKNPDLVVNLQQCDLGDLKATQKMLQDVYRQVGDIDILINNAGFGDICLIDRTPWEKLDQMIRVNITALTFLTHQLLIPMIKRGRGGILNVSSSLGLTFFPGISTYTATKSYVTSFTESLRQEVRGTGVVVCQVCPGPVATEFESVAGNPVGRSVPKFVELTAEQCARKSLRGFAHGKALIIPGFWIRSVMWLARMSPRVLLRATIGWIGKYLRGLPKR